MEPTTDDEPLLLDTTTADRASSMVFTVNDKSTTASGTHILASPLEQDNEYPDGGFDAWMAVFASFIFHFLAVGINYAFGVYANYYSRMGLASMSVLSFIGATAVFFMVGLGIVSGRLAEKFGFRSMMTAGTTLLCSGLFVASFCTQVWELILTQGVLFGVGMSVAYFPAVSLPSQWFEKRRGLATGIAVSGSGIGGLFMSLVTQELLGSIGFAWTMRITALAVFGERCSVLLFSMIINFNMESWGHGRPSICENKSSISSSIEDRLDCSQGQAFPLAPGDKLLCNLFEPDTSLLLTPLRD
ncbi:major facilitator superfamily domain-containing protein [Chytriomyces sp. MP71]|nr:major facilitator superfamily domain-containing protein [Chytriomyces sp. MP71]